MDDEKITLAIYGQHCSGKAGTICYDPESRYGEDWRDSADLDVFEGTREELAEIANAFRHNAQTAGAGNDLFLLKQARLIEEAIS